MSSAAMTKKVLLVIEDLKIISVYMYKYSQDSVVRSAGDQKCIRINRVYELSKLVL